MSRPEAGDCAYRDLNRLAEESPYGRYLAFLEQGKLVFQRDPETGRAVFYPRVAAPGTGACGLVWEVSAGTGTVYATTVVHYRGEVPLNVSLIDMDEGFRLMSRVEGIPPSELRIGTRVRMRVHRPDEGQPYPVFDVDRTVALPSRAENEL
ncbi:MAG: OB-fold domain-containing protein [Pigmentiphaga sp.]|uniref:Zn-ribbon domain-containing OB-fold protein n=1 Tax=Pigmentiphaga sp. TaxID=1977564 RepID=UPI0029B72E50|nr:OB-fold domain-containing protein [Pigmentiphaga sp.]MDX3904294.1 OB-fold domain-containing protein [Pigmentiphaga sp.]